MTPKQGYITAAVHARRHLEMAVDLRLSLRDIDPARPCALVTDQSCAKGAHALLRVFEHVEIIPEIDNYGHSAKLYVAERQVFNQTLFLDADCLVLGPLNDLWEALQSREFCVPGLYVDKTCTQHHHNYSIASLCETFGLERYYFASSPIFYFSEAGRAVMHAIRKTYNTELRHGAVRRWDRDWPPDEIAFAVVGGRVNFAPFPPLQTIIKQPNLPSWTVGKPPFPVFHCTMCPSLDVLSELMQHVAARRRAEGLPQGSRRHWVKKALYKKTQRSITQALGLPWRSPFRAASPSR
jgi:hypothetical protein